MEDQTKQTKKHIIEDLNNLRKRSNSEYYQKIIKLTKESLKHESEEEINANLANIKLLHKLNSARMKQLEDERNFLEIMETIVELNLYK
jgi:hypothetical protein